jgi:ankyrin repeat protein
MNLTPEELEKARLLFQWARAGDPRLVSLLEQGLPANMTNDAGDTLLMLAAYHGHAELVAALLQHGADPARCNDRGQSPLAGGADANHRLSDGKTAFMFAAMFNRVEVMQLLLRHGADADAADASGMTAAMLADKMNAQDALALLEDLSAGRSSH